MNTSFVRLAMFLFSIYAVSFILTAFYLRGGGPPDLYVSGVQAEGLVVGRLPMPVEFSDAAPIPGKNAALIVEDESKDSLFVLTFGPDRSAPDTMEWIPLPAGFHLKDMEGIAVDGRGFVYVVSSHSLNSEGKPRRGSALARMSLESNGDLRGADTISDLRDWLESEIPEIAAVRTLPTDAGGLNIEGLAYDPDRERLLLGLRGPLWGNHPALIPIRLKTPNGPFRRDALELEEPIVLDTISGFGVRAISYDGPSKSFWILTGGGGDSKKTKNRFQVWRWDGTDQPPRAVDGIRFDKKIKTRRSSLKFHPEGICILHPANADPVLLIVADGCPFYFKMDLPGKLLE
ncbi:DUF3616 domain-containing protein [bacterium]|nr:DUF3616 domain-containing protein [bacterium]